MPDSKRILIVDDEEINLKLLEAMLHPMGYTIYKAKNGKEALRKVKENNVDLILLDIMMPEMNGYEVAKILKEDEETRLIPIVMVTALSDLDSRVKALEVGADDFLSKPVDKTELRARVKSLLKVKEYNDHMKEYQKRLEEEVKERTKELRKAFEKIKRLSLDTIYRLSKAAEYKDEETGQHIMRVSNYAAAIAKEMGLGDKVAEALLYATPMHDIGKIGIPDHILLKPGRLTPEEFEIMKRHTLIGAEILHGAESGFLKLGEIIALTHHERWDGKGYPRGLKGREIPLAGRIVAISDVFDALISKRPYKEPYPVEKSLKIIKEERGSHFDPEVVDAFFKIIDQILSIKDRYRDKD